MNLAKAGDLSRDETSMLRGQGILSSRELPGNTEEYPQGLTSACTLCVARVVQGHSQSCGPPVVPPACPATGMREMSAP